ncbi:cytochrome P450 [uncultured Jannaschia sp.]|uniref:cytochrome P450 n=1 Tax=uncultured Jannaschia sp. TaxID=293347 RepID=UPI002623E364|nr:cytochrome P450 [uncultured Jannaschia sp.]
MAFLEELATAQSPEASGAVFVKWLRTDWRTMYSELRAAKPILQIPSLTLVTRATDVLDILAQPSLFSVNANRLPMDEAVGPFMLARDETELNWEEKGLMQAVLRWEDLPTVRALAADTARKALEAADGTLDAVPEIARAVPLRIVQRIFGFDAPDEQLLAWSFATQHGMFRNLPFNKQVLADCQAAGREMREWLWQFLSRDWSAASLQGNDAVTRLMSMSRSTSALLPPERVITNVCGLLIGTIETMSAAIIQATDQFIAHPDWLAAARATDSVEATDAFDAHIFEALRFSPVTTFQFRTVEVDRTLAAGTEYATPVKAGTLLAVATGSAMFDAALMPNPDKFDATRPPNSYLHFGLGHHECLGRHISRVAVPEAVRQILRQPGVRRVAGTEGQLDFAGGPFPEHLRIAWDTSVSTEMCS